MPMKPSLSETSAAAKLSAGDFYSEYHGHPISQLEALHASLVRLGEARDGRRPRFAFLVGDSSLDNKHWFFGPSASKASQLHDGAFTAAATPGYADVLAPPRMVMDVSYHMNALLAERRDGAGGLGGEAVYAINASVEESTIADRLAADADGGVRLLAHDAFVRDALTERDVVVLSLGGNDVALRPSAATIAAMGLLTRVTPTWLLRLGCAPGLGHFFALFHDRIEEIVTKIAAANGGRKPAKVLVCMIYYLDETPGGSWADGVLSKLGYDSDPAKLKLIIQMLFERVAAAGFRVDGVEVVPFALFKVLDGTDSRDYVQRVEPSVQGGRKMARAIVDELFPRPPSSSPHDGDDMAVVEPTQRT
jgi:hypothetical protein